jgi:WD40 repeat protein
VELAVAEGAYQSLRTFPGHVDAANSLYRGFLQNRAESADDISQIETLVAMAEDLPMAGNLPEQIVAGFWDRKTSAAMRHERREEALLATIESLALATPQRRNRAAMLVSNDFPLLVSSLPVADQANIAFNPHNLLITATAQSQVSQWTLGNQEFQRRDAWPITALEVTPLVRRVVVDSAGMVRRIGLTINLSHARVSDLRIKIIAPSGRAVEIEPRVDRASSNQDIRIDPSQLKDLLDETITGTWSLSVRDEELSVAGQLVGWNLQLNSQGLIEDFQRGLNIADPVERETNKIWLSSDGRFAVARATQSDSARIWDLALAKPVRAVAVAEQEQFIGLSADARRLVTATRHAVNLWDTTSGDRVATLEAGSASTSSTLTANGTHLLAQRRNVTDTRFELWALGSATITAELDVAGSPALVSLDATGKRIAIADYDRAVRVWDFQSGELLAQIDLAEQPSRIELAAGGEVLGVLFGNAGASLWRIDRPKHALFEEFGRGDWNMAFALSGTQVLIGRPAHGFQVYATEDGRVLGPAIGAGGDGNARTLLGFSADEKIIVSGGPDNVLRSWKSPGATAVGQVAGTDTDSIWPPAGDAVVVATPDAASFVIGDRQGDVHVLSTTGVREALLAEGGDVSFLGHSRRVRILVMSPDGATVASAAGDNSIRVWNTSDGLPQPFFGHISGNPIEQMVFSPDAARLGVLSNNQVHIIDAASGSVLAELALGEPHEGLAFADNSHLYLGSESGVLRVLQQGSGGDWGLQTVWRGGVAIRKLEVSPHSRFLVVVDQNNLAQQFILAEGRLGASALQLPGPVEEVRFTPNGSRVLFRTARWIHRANSAAFGLRWIDAVLAPRSISTARMVLGTDNKSSAAAGSRVFLPVAGDGYVQLVELNLDNTRGTALFGNREELRAEWRHRFGMDQDSNLAGRN